MKNLLSLLYQAACVSVVLSSLFYPSRVDKAGAFPSASFELRALTQLSNDGSSSPFGGEWRVYTPPAESRNPGNNYVPAGRRGGCGDELVAIAPRLFSGRTTATRPTFIWYGWSDAAAVVEFQLYQYQPDGLATIIPAIPVEPTAAGFVTYTLPPEQAELTVGDTYFWRVVSYCDQDRQELGFLTSAFLEVVESPAELAEESSETPLERAQTLARQGIWYDALAQVYDANTPETQRFLENLLLDLADAETQFKEPGDFRIRHIRLQLERIIEEGLAEAEQ